MKSRKIEAPGILMIHSNLLVVFINKYSVFIMTDDGDCVSMVDNNILVLNYRKEQLY